MIYDMHLFGCIPDPGRYDYFFKGRGFWCWTSFVYIWGQQYQLSLINIEYQFRENKNCESNLKGKQSTKSIKRILKNKFFQENCEW